MPKKHPGPLSDIRVLEFAGLGPAPFSGMLLADLGADVVRIDREAGPDYKPEDVESRGRSSIVLDLKSDDGLKTAKALAGKAHILIEGFRPGVMERLGLGPDELLALNPSLVYGRITGWGQTGPLSRLAGHDINYLGLTGALHAMGTTEKPAIPLNLVADFGGGAMYLVMGILAALHHATRSGEGQVVDAAMTDGVISLMNMIYGDFAVGAWKDTRESNVIDGAAPFYNVYQCADGKWVSLACIEPPFYKAFIAKADLHDEWLTSQWDRDSWPSRITELETFFSGKTRDEWMTYFANDDVCIGPVLSLAEAPGHPHNQARNSFQNIADIPQAGAFPLLNKTPSTTPHGVHTKNQDHESILGRWSIPKS